MTATTTPALAADLDGGLRRLKLGAMRRPAPELMVTAKTQRWSPEEFLQMLLDTEITSRDESNARTRMKAAAFPHRQDHRVVWCLVLSVRDLATSSIPRATFDYLTC
jgi:DNA replication protein DnaC